MLAEVALCKAQEGKAEDLQEPQWISGGLKEETTLAELR